jgi:DNA primase
VLIPEHKIQEVIARVDIVDLIGRHVELKKSGHSFKGRCPFHNEKTPSFYVTPERRNFKCFGCGAGGDAISFVQRLLGKTFVDTVRDLAKEVGVDLQAAEDPAQKERTRLKEATDAAFEFFRSRLWDAAIGKQARAYLESRGVSEDTARVFGLGWAPAAWSELADLLRSKGILEFAFQAGLVQKRQKSEGFYDVFRGRVMVPIRTPEGRTIAFGGRLLVGDEGPKYLNSRESKLYNKSEVLYGVDQAREEIRKRKVAVLVEGYFDCIGLHQVGVKHTVALCSTALTPGHLALLSRLEAKELVLLLDGDEAGRKAVERLAGAILASGASAKVALLPEGDDPDTFARRVGSAGVFALLDSARPLSEHLFFALLPDGEAASFEHKMSALERLKPVAAQLPVGLMRSAFFAAMSRHFGLPASELETALRGNKPAPKPVPKPQAPPPALKQPERAPDSLECTFVAYALKDPTLLRQDSFRVADELTHPGLRTVCAALAGGTSREELLEQISDATRRALEGTARLLPRETAADAFAALCKKLKLRHIDDQLRHIAKVTGQVQGDGNGELSEDVRRLMSERVALLALRKRVIEEPVLPSGTGLKRTEQPV